MSEIRKPPTLKEMNENLKDHPEGLDGKLDWVTKSYYQRTLIDSCEYGGHQYQYRILGDTINTNDTVATCSKCGKILTVGDVLSHHSG